MEPPLAVAEQGHHAPGHHVLDLCTRDSVGDEDVGEEHARHGVDVQGVPWERMPWSREHYRAERCAAYRNFVRPTCQRRLRLLTATLQVNCAAVPPEVLAAECCQPPPAPTELYTFRYNARTPRCLIAHFQLRQLVWATSRTAVWYAGDGGLYGWCGLRRQSWKALDTEHGHALGHLQLATAAASAQLGLLAAGGFNGELLLAKLPQVGQTAQVVHASRIAGPVADGITNALELVPDGPGGAPALLASNNDARVRLFALGTGAPSLVSEHALPWAVNCAVLNPSSRHQAACVGDAPEVALLDLRAPNSEGMVTLAGHRDFSFAAAWHRGGTLLATGSQESTARVWDVRMPGAALAAMQGRMAAVRSLRFSPDGATLAVAEAADFVHLVRFNPSAAKVLVEDQVVDLFGELAGVAFSPCGDAFFAGLSDATYGSLVELKHAVPPRAAFLAA